MKKQQKAKAKCICKESIKLNKKLKELKNTKDKEKNHEQKIA